MKLLVQRSKGHWELIALFLLIILVASWGFWLLGKIQKDPNAGATREMYRWKLHCEQVYRQCIDERYK